MHRDPDPSEQIEILAELTDGVRVVMVVIDSPEGRWHARPMTVVAREGASFWFLFDRDADWIEGGRRAMFTVNERTGRQMGERGGPRLRRRRPA